MSEHEHEHIHQCGDLLDSLSDYIDGELRDELCREIEKHIAGCENCRVVVDTMKKTVYLYHETAQDAQQVPVDVRERLFKSLNLEDYLLKS